MDADFHGSARKPASWQNGAGAVGHCQLVTGPRLAGDGFLRSLRYLRRSPAADYFIGAGLVYMSATEAQSQWPAIGHRDCRSGYRTTIDGDARYLVGTSRFRFHHAVVRRQQARNTDRNRLRAAINSGRPVRVASKTKRWLL